MKNTEREKAKAAFVGDSEKGGGSGCWPAGGGKEDKRFWHGSIKTIVPRKTKKRPCSQKNNKKKNFGRPVDLIIWKGRLEEVRGLAEGLAQLDLALQFLDPKKKKKWGGYSLDAKTSWGKKKGKKQADKVVKKRGVKRSGT